MLAKGFSVPTLQHPELPSAVSWFPLPEGWWWLLSVVLICLMAFLLVRAARWYRNRWRREARTLLHRVEDADSWLNLIKRIQLVHHPRALISEQSEPESILAELPLTETLRQQLCRRYCQADNHLSSADNQQLRQQIQRWLEALPDV